MGSSISDFSKYIPSEESAETNLGDAISGTFSDIELDSVETIRKIRRDE